MKLTITNFKAPSLNKSYSGRHWSARHKEALEIQRLVWGCCKVQDLPQVKNYPVDIMITAYYKSKAKRDSGNVSNKELIDGLVLAGIIEDDNTRFVRRVTTQALIGQKENKVMMEVYGKES